MPYANDVPERTRRFRFVTLCQQLLALAVVVAVLTPAARTVTMDVRPAQPLDIDANAVGLQAAAFPSEVPTGTVEPAVEEYALTEAAEATEATDATAPATVAAEVEPHAENGEAITSEELPVDGYGTVGVTWSPEDRVGDDKIAVEVRTRTGDEWSEWTEAEYHDEHGPDASTEEGKKARPGTDALLVGDVDAVQVKVATEESAPADLKIAVVAPGEATATTKQMPAIDTARSATPASPTSPATPAPGEDDEPVEQPDPAPGTDSLDLQASTPTPKPMIYSRAQWGANEKLRDARSLAYYEVHGGFVHHTVNANDYTAAQVPSIIRGIYAYHTKTRGWSDIGYNFLIDRFGRIWEGRAGGVDRAVVGAHTQGYNNYAFAASAIGNFETAKPTSKLINAYGSLLAWKLSLHGVSAASTAQRIGSKTFPAISGHRDAGKTACPGKHLYAKIPRIRQLAAAAQRVDLGREATGRFVKSGATNVIVRRDRDNRLITLVIKQSAAGVWKVARKVDSGRTLSKNVVSIMRAGDWDRDGSDDLIARKKNGVLLLLRGKGNGTFHGHQVLSDKLKTATLISAPGDVSGDGYPDLMAQPKGGSMRIYPGRGAVGLGTSRDNLPTSYAAYGKVTGTDVVAAGFVNADGAPDALVRRGTKTVLYTGNGPGGWSSQRVVEKSTRGYDWLIGVGRVDGDARSDFVGRKKSNGELFLLIGNGETWKKRHRLGIRNTYDIAG
ncbi:N-acetylmuramoyl-L-alanine amidase [Nocardioides sp. zg-ZUI104]|uniref:N-acetylmuramoyl-L-alanine amidase n=1 Tax=Nocardioides faecalis TaxID=2803858 RepID=UPI001BD03345|nr:N-acetylmuramoyl-L-alanine amidase [Nocardioides faecalis]MBS4751569.1 N-acetylmuramoyl-L-alanine amidase [Nocardioides faecalis]